MAPQSMSTALPPAVGMAGGHGGTADAPDPLDQQGAGGEKGPGAAGGDKGIPLPRLQQVQAHGDGGVLFHLEGGGGVVVHVDDLRGVDHGHPRRQATALLRRSADLSLPAHQNKLQAGPGLGGVEDPADDLQGGVVAAMASMIIFMHFLLIFGFSTGAAGGKTCQIPLSGTGSILQQYTSRHRPGQHPVRKISEFVRANPRPSTLFPINIPYFF